jgi:hypothetical protein
MHPLEGSTHARPNYFFRTENRGRSVSGPSDRRRPRRRLAPGGVIELCATCSCMWEIDFAALQTQRDLRN